jgi:hypothetical protein
MQGNEVAKAPLRFDKRETRGWAFLCGQRLSRLEHTQKAKSALSADASNNRIINL